MTRRRRRQEARELAQRFQDLPPEHAGRVGLVLLGNALVSVAVQIVLLGMYVRLVRRLWRNRQHGLRRTAGSARSRSVLLCTCCYGCYAVLSRVLLLRWARRVAERAEQGTG